MSASYAQDREPVSIRRIRRRRGFLQRALVFVFSPAFAVCLVVIGYYVFTPFTNILFPDGSLGGIIIRTGTLLIILVTFMRFGGRRNGVNMRVLLPLTLFVFAYVMRLIENYYFNDIFIPFEPAQLFLIFIMSGIFPAFILAQMQGAVRDEQIMPAVTLLCLLFLVGMALNMDELQASRGINNRLTLEKINPIAMANTAFEFIIFYVLVFMRSRRYLIEAGVLVPVLLLIALYSGSRAALASGAISVIIYVLLLKGTRRIWMMVAITLAALVIGSILGAEHFTVMIDRFYLMFAGNSSDGSTKSHLLSWGGAFQQFLDDPITGKYIIEQYTGYYPHNIYLESLMAVGLLGSIPFFIHIALATRAAIGIIRTPGFGIAPVFVALFFFRESIARVSGGAIWSAPEYWACSALVIAFWYGRVRSSRGVKQRQGLMFNSLGDRR